MIDLAAKFSLFEKLNVYYGLWILWLLGPTGPGPALFYHAVIYLGWWCHQALWLILNYWFRDPADINTRSLCKCILHSFPYVLSCSYTLLQYCLHYWKASWWNFKKEPKIPWRHTHMLWKKFCSLWRWLAHQLADQKRKRKSLTGKTKVKKREHREKKASHIIVFHQCNVYHYSFHSFISPFL